MNKLWPRSDRGSPYKELHVWRELWRFKNTADRDNDILYYIIIIITIIIILYYIIF